MGSVEMQSEEAFVIQAAIHTPASAGSAYQKPPLHHQHVHQNAEMRSGPAIVTQVVMRTTASVENVIHHHPSTIHHHPNTIHHLKPLQLHRNAHQDAKMPSEQGTVTRVAMLTTIFVDNVLLKPHLLHHNAHQNVEMQSDLGIATQVA